MGKEERRRKRGEIQEWGTAVREERQDGKRAQEWREKAGRRVVLGDLARREKIGERMERKILNEWTRWREKY